MGPDSSHCKAQSSAKQAQKPPCWATLKADLGEKEGWSQGQPGAACGSQLALNGQESRGSNSFTTD